MTANERTKLRVLAWCSLWPRDRWFVRSLLRADLEGRAVALTPKQLAWLDQLWHRYRVQLTHMYRMHPKSFGEVRPECPLPT